MTKPERKPYIFYLPDDTGEFVTTDALANGAVTEEKLSRDVKDLVNSIQNKADKSGTYPDMSVGHANTLSEENSGTYPDMTVGFANNLLPLHQAPVSGEYLYRTSGGEADIADGKATISSIQGNTFVWNQIAPEVASDNYIRGDTNTSVSISDGIITATAIESTKPLAIVKGTNLAVTVDHKYYGSCEIKPSANGNSFGMSLNSSSVGAQYNRIGGIDSASSSVWSRISGIVTYNTPAAGNPSIRVSGTIAQTVAEDTLQVRKIMVIDLTQMFGAGNEPSTVAEFEALYPLDYYAYNAGSLLNVNMQGVETVGFNQWNEEWEVGSYNASGEKTSSTTTIRCKNMIHVFANVAYYFQFSSGKITRICFYDSNGTCIKSSDFANSPKVVTTPSAAYYMTFVMNNEYGTTYKHDICINISGSRNGEYEPYWSSQLAIPVSTYYPTGMKSAGTVHDELKADEAVTRIGAITVEGSNVTFPSAQLQSNEKWVAYLTISGRKTTSTANENVVSNYTDYKTTLESCAETVGSILVRGNSLLCIGVGTQADATAAKAAANALVAATPLVMFYELATPTTVAIDPPLNLAYRVSDFGTERIIVDTTAPAPQSAPPIVNTIYGMNAVDVIRRLPSEYISHASFENFTAALATYLSATITETWDSANNEYDYAIEAAAEQQADSAPEEAIEEEPEEVEEAEEVAEEIEETAEEEAR